MPKKKLTVFRRQNTGFIFQSFNLIPELNVEQNITFPLLLDYQKPDQQYVEELLEILGLKERRKHFPSQISEDQQQRVAIGMAVFIMADMAMRSQKNYFIKTNGEYHVALQYQ